MESLSPRLSSSEGKYKYSWISTENQVLHLSDPYKFLLFFFNETTNKVL